MTVTRNRTSRPGESGITFPRLECWNSATRMATVAAQVNKQRVLCRISQKTLSEKFGASKDEPMQSVAEHRVAIQDAAKILIENGSYEADGSVLILPRDLV